MVRRKTGERKQEILQALAMMLEAPNETKITTAALAAKLGISEAALYRHFASKAQMFEGLIEFIESSIFGVINRICTDEESGLIQAQNISWLLLGFAEKNPGTTRVMIGDALINENPRLIKRMNQFFDRVELTLRQSMRLAATQEQYLNETSAVMRSSLLMNSLIGRMTRFVKSGFSLSPTIGMQEQTAFILSAVGRSLSSME